MWLLAPARSRTTGRAGRVAATPSGLVLSPGGGPGKGFSWVRKFGGHRCLVVSAPAADTKGLPPPTARGPRLRCSLSPVTRHSQLLVAGRHRQGRSGLFSTSPQDAEDAPWQTGFPVLSALGRHTQHTFLSSSFTFYSKRSGPPPNMGRPESGPGPCSSREVTAIRGPRTLLHVWGLAERRRASGCDHTRRGRSAPRLSRRRLRALDVHLTGSEAALSPSEPGQPGEVTTCKASSPPSPRGQKIQGRLVSTRPPQPRRHERLPDAAVTAGTLPHRSGTKGNRLPPSPHACGLSLDGNQSRSVRHRRHPPPPERHAGERFHFTAAGALPRAGSTPVSEEEGAPAPTRARALTHGRASAGYGARLRLAVHRAVSGYTAPPSCSLDFPKRKPFLGKKTEHHPPTTPHKDPPIPLRSKVTLKPGCCAARGPRPPAGLSWPGHLSAFRFPAEGPSLQAASWLSDVPLQFFTTPSKTRLGSPPIPLPTDVLQRHPLYGVDTHPSQNTIFQSEFMQDGFGLAFSTHVFCYLVLYYAQEENFLNISAFTITIP